MYPNKTIIDIKDIIEGRFGPVELGMSVREVKEILGPPDEVRETSRGDMHYLIYGGYVIHFERVSDSEATVCAFENTMLEHPDGLLFENEKIKVIPWILRYGMTLQEVCAELQDAGMNYTINTKYDETFVIFDNKATLGFCNTGQNPLNKKWLLLSIGYLTEY